ncbi:hypothetical protein [Streptomonospora wellingtoniae]|uniref:Uncharacterized protein n=1 Tax=Streptomonospora wellingtoniae TaxID=3075544 RepID=A0ABU2KYT3_9ACTN|nr:hypothetical protein [Streptomonospora sp. DSM 45055]MDT0304228.1 hypothetical protein [Streptomonospora sp. DSM 45055]
MKFGHVDPAEPPAEDGTEAFAHPGGEPSAEPVADDAPEAAEHDENTGPDDEAEAGRDADQDPQARLKASTRRLASQVKLGAEQIDDSLTKLARQVADLRMAEIGQHPVQHPSVFRADRFSAGRTGSREGAEGSAPSARPESAETGRSASGRTVEPNAYGERPSIRDRR